VLRAATIALLGLALLCGNARATAADWSDGRIHARPATHPLVPRTPGVKHIAGDGLLYVPLRCARTRRCPVVLSLHGATQDAWYGLNLFRTEADRAGLIVLAPKSRGRSWDAVGGAYGRDVAAIDGHLRSVFRRYAVDPRRVYIGGFSDGASYALSLGLTNGDLFKAVVAFSPGFASPAQLRRRPPIFVSHGTSDPILPIDGTSRRLVPELRRNGYRVTYREFRGTHWVPPAIGRAAVSWLAKR
jgi:predicted esterase